MVDVVVLGAGGPIGQAIGRRAARHGLDVLLTSRRGDVRLDVADRPAVAATLRERSPVALVDLVNPSTDPDDEAIDRTVDDVAAIVSAAADAGVTRIVQASSAAVYGDIGSRPFGEDDELRGRSAYARLKISAERVVQECASSVGVSALSMRIFNVFGPACLGSLVNKLTDGRKPLLAMSADYVRDYVHVDDVADAVLIACARPEAQGVVNVASGVAVDNLTLASAVSPYSYIAGPADIVSYSVGDVRRAEESLGWRARRSALDLLRSSRMSL